MSAVEFIWRGDEVYAWRGPGWYASRQGRDMNCNPVITTYQVPGEQDRDVTPETYSLGLGTPFWMDARP